MVEFCHELRFPFAKWIIAKQVHFLKLFNFVFLFHLICELLIARV